MTTSKLSTYENEFNQVISIKAKFEYIISLFKEFQNQALMALDISAEWTEEAEEDFEELGGFLSEKMQSLHDDLSD